MYYFILSYLTLYYLMLSVRPSYPGIAGNAPPPPPPRLATSSNPNNPLTLTHHPKLSLQVLRQQRRQRRQSILSQEVLCFTRIVPLDLHATPHRCREWALAVALGATCTLDFSAAVTVVVAGALGTAKGLEAKKRGCPVTKVAWLEACAAQGKRVDPGMYAW